MIYLDNNATTRVADEVLEAMRPCYTDSYGNPHSAHRLGRAAHDLIEGARERVSRLIGASGRGTLTFTSCGTESNALVIRSFAAGRKARFVATAVEHPSVMLLLRELESQGHELRIVGVDESGRIDLDAMAASLEGGADLVCAMLAQNESGVIHDVPSAAALARRAGAQLLVDAVQAAGKIPLNVDDLGADHLSLSGHKFHAPKGIGALWSRDVSPLVPLWRGGGQEHGLRSGTESVPLIAGLGRAAELALETLPRMERVKTLRDRFESTVAAATDVRVNGAAADRLPNTSSISFRDADATALVAALDERGVCVSAGAACHSGIRRASAVMAAMAVPEAYALGTVRFSLSRYTTPEEIETAAKAVADAVSASII